MRTPALRWTALERQRVLVEERPAAVIRRHVDDVAERKPSRMPCFTQVLTRQPVRRRRIRLGGAHLAGGQRGAQPRERLARRVRDRRRRRRRTSASIVCLPASRRHRAARLCEQPQRLEHLPDLRARRVARRHHRQPVDSPRAGPSPPSRTSPGSGFDSTKLTSISGSSCAWICARGREVAALGAARPSAPSPPAPRSTPPR